MNHKDLFHLRWMRRLNDQEGEPSLRFVLNAHGRLEWDTEQFAGSHLCHFISNLEGSLSVDHCEGDIRVGIVMGNLLTRLETHLIDLEIVFIQQIVKTALLFLKDLFLLQIDDVHTKFLSCLRSVAGTIPRWLIPIIFMFFGRFVKTFDLSQSSVAWRSQPKGM